MTAIVSSDVLFKLSAPNANSGNTQAGYAGTSWGGWLSTTLLNTVILADNLFTDITGPENAAGQVDYACLFIQNNTASGNLMMNVVAWIPLQLVTGTGSSFALAADPIGVTGINSTSPQAVKINSSVIPPAGVTNWAFPTSVTPTGPSYVNGIVLGNIAPTQCVALWLRRTALNSASPSLSAFPVQIMFNTGS